MDPFTHASRFSWQELFCREQKGAMCRFIIFGASGDLAKRKLFPALFSLYKEDLLHKDTLISCCARHSFSTETFRNYLSETLFHAPLSELEKSFLQKISYMVLDYADMEDFSLLAKHLLTEKEKNLPFIFYFALPSPIYPSTVENLYKTGLLCEEQGKRRIIFEKPFGFDLASAIALNTFLKKFLIEKQIYRIDHYLGKETVQNIFLLRFANRIFEPLWNRKYVEEIQISALETLGVEKRASYFDRAGILRDMFQNHLLEMLALATMEMPEIFTPDAVRNEKYKLLSSIRKIAFSDAVRAQYENYTKEENIPENSRTETFAALRLFIDNKRWKNVPIYLRAGKKLGIQKTQINIIFKEIDHSIFPGIDKKDLQRNILHLYIQPREGLGLTLEAKKQGPKLCMGALTLSYDYPFSGNKKSGMLDAYARLLLDCLNEDQTLFIRSDIIERSWLLYQTLLDHWEADKFTPIPQYKQGSRGPVEADFLLRKNGSFWYDY